MDDYIEPIDSRKLKLGIHQSPLSTNHYSDDDDDDDDCYTTPYQSVPGPGGLVWKKPASLDPTSEDIYEIVPGKNTQTKTVSDYDVPPSRISTSSVDHGVPASPRKSRYPDLNPETDDYCHLTHNGTSAGNPVPAKKTVSDSEQHSEDEDDSYSHTSSWVAQKAERQNSNASNAPPPPSPHKPGGPSTPKTATRQSSNGSLSGSSPVLANPPSKAPAAEGARAFSRQRGIHPRKSSSSSSSGGGGGGGDSETGSQQSSAPVIYEEAWDTLQQQKRLEENLRLARSISTCSDTFEDALEFLPEDWAPARPRAAERRGDSGRGAGGGAKTIDPVTGGDYEPAWDLNRGLEERLRRVQVTHSASDLGGGGGGGEGSYQEPWDLAQKQRELERRIQMARAEGGRGSAPRSPQHQQQSAPAEGGGELYEMPWDTKRGLAQMLQSPHNVDGGSRISVGGSGGCARSSQSVSGTVGEPINAMIPLNNQEWYHGNISRDDAEQMLRVCKDGSYLVRDSSDRCHFTLSIKSAVQMIHIQIDQCQKADGSMRYILGRNSKAFCTIPSMIDHYTHHIVPIRGADHMTLLFPVHCKYSGGEESHA
ncbi:hypothetical protein ACOMHN_050813 [Nucella lapillus]